MKYLSHMAVLISILFSCNTSKNYLNSSLSYNEYMGGRENLSGYTIQIFIDQNLDKRIDSIGFENIVFKDIEQWQEANKTHLSANIIRNSQNFQLIQLLQNSPDSLNIKFYAGERIFTSMAKCAKTELKLNH